MSDFDKAVADSKKLTSKPSNDELLQLYGKSSSPSLPLHRLQSAQEPHDT